MVPLETSSTPGPHSLPKCYVYRLKIEAPGTQRPAKMLAGSHLPWHGSHLTKSTSSARRRLRRSQHGPRTSKSRHKQSNQISPQCMSGRWAFGWSDGRSEASAALLYLNGPWPQPASLSCGPAHCPTWVSGNRRVSTEYFNISPICGLGEQLKWTKDV